MYIPVVVAIAEISCPLILVTKLLLVVKHSTTLSVVTGLVVVWVSLTIVVLLVDCCWLYSIVSDCINGVVDDLWGKWLTDAEVLVAKPTVI